MADALVKHAFVSAIPEGTDATKIRTSNWNASLLFTGGTAGELLVRDTGSATGAAWSATPTLTRLGIGAVPYANNALYLTNPNGPGLHIKGGSTSDSRASIVFENSAGSIRSAFNPEGMFYTNGWVTISGGFTAAQNGNGDLTTFTTGATGLASMLDITADVQYGVVVKSAAVASPANYVGWDRSSNFTHAVMEAGQVQWGASTTLASMDTGLARNAAGVLEVNSTVLGTWRDLQVRTLLASTGVVLANNASVDFKESGGTLRSVLQLDTGNILRLQQIATAHLIIKGATSREIRFMDQAESAYIAVMFNGTQNTTFGTNADGAYKVHVARSGATGTFLAYDSTASTGVTRSVVREGAGQSASEVFGVYANDGTTLRFGVINGDVKWGKALVALGGGAAPTLGTIGGSGPATAAQNTWMRVLDSAGAAFWVPAWK